MCVGGCSFKLDGDTWGWLEIDAATGQIRTKGELDRETTETFEFTVTAFEKGEVMEVVTVTFRSKKKCTFLKTLFSFPLFKTTQRCLPSASST